MTYFTRNSNNRDNAKIQQRNVLVKSNTNFQHLKSSVHKQKSANLHLVDIIGYFSYHKNDFYLLIKQSVIQT